MINDIQIISLKDFKVVHRLKKTIDSFFSGEMGIMETRNTFKATLQKLSTTESVLKESLSLISNQFSGCLDSKLEEFKSVAIMLGALLEKQYTRLIEFSGLDELSEVEFCDAETFEMKLSFEEKTLRFRAEYVYLKIVDKFVWIKNVNVLFRDWTDYYAVQAFTEESGKDNKVGSDFFEPLVDLPFFEVSNEKNTVQFFGSGEFVYDDFEYHFINPKVSGTFEWEKDPNP